MTATTLLNKPGHHHHHHYHHHHQTTKLRHSINAIGPVPHRQQARYHFDR
jgi:hypothetical protein